MKLRASEFISKAENLKSSELSVRQKLEDIRSRRVSIQDKIEMLEYRLDALQMQLEILKSTDSGDDEDGVDNSDAIAEVMNEITSIQGEISENLQTYDELRLQEMETDAELRQVEMEEQEILSDIQDSASRTNQNIALISSFGGDYANVSAQASASFQHNLSQLSQAAQILGGSVAMGAAGTGGRSVGRMAGSNGGQTDGKGRNFYETANNQRKSGNSSFGAMGAKRDGGLNSVRKTPDLYSKSALEGERPVKKSGGFGKKGSSLKQNIVNAFNLGGAVKEFSGCTAVKRADQHDCWDIPGTGFITYEDFRNNHGNYERITYDTPRMETAAADNIEGISNIRTADVEHPEIFWGRDSGKTMQDFMDIAQHIPEVKEQLKNGRSLDDLMMDDQLGKCTSIYFANAPTVYKGDGFYEFSGNGRHRILAARALGLEIPVVVAGEIRYKKQAGLGQKVHSGKNEQFSETDKVYKQEKEIEKVESGEKDFDRMNTHETGNYGEMKTDQNLRKKGYERISHEMITDIDGKTHQGLDGVYYNPDGKPQYVIVDAKYGSSQLGETKDGKQMSDAWIDARLDKDIGPEKADMIRMEKIFKPDNVGCYVAHIDVDGNVTYDKLDGDANAVEKDVKINE